MAPPQRWRTVAPIIIATTYPPVTAPTRGPRCSFTTPVSNTPATPMPLPTRMVPQISDARFGMARTRLPAATTATAVPSARSRPNRSPKAAPVNEPKAIISTAPDATSPAAPADTASSLRTVASSGG